VYKKTWRAMLFPRGKLQVAAYVYHWIKSFRVVGVSGLAFGRAAAGSPGTLLVACTPEMWLEILNRTAEN
jgi:hypothetical protein